MKIGLQINRFDSDGGSKQIAQNIKTEAQSAEEAGFDSEWVMDHFFQIGYLGPATDPMIEAYTTLGYLAGVTSKVTLGTMVSGVIYREPAVLVKIVTALDILSGGRAYFGIGAGWNEEEAVGLGLPRPLQNDRFERLEETLIIAKQMWAGDESAIKGKHYQLERPISNPQPVQKPHPPILIGGGGEQKTLKLVAKYGDACNLFATADVAHKLDVLKQHCRDAGTDYDRIEKTMLMSMTVGRAVDNAEATLKRCQEMAGLGIDHVMFSNDSNADRKVYEAFGSKLAAKIHAM